VVLVDGWPLMPSVMDQPPGPTMLPRQHAEPGEPYLLLTVYEPVYIVR